MNRVIKFRGKCAGAWRKGDHLTYANGEVIKAWMGSISPEYTVEPETVGQFTGFKDIDGKEIYEGDIIRNDGCMDDEIYRVAMVEGCWSGVDVEDAADLSWLLSHAPFKVIGNIHDNAKLLEGGD